MSCPVIGQRRPVSKNQSESTQICGPFPVRRQATHPLGAGPHPSTLPQTSGNSTNPAKPANPVITTAGRTVGPPVPPLHVFDRSYAQRPPPRLNPYNGEYRMRYPERAASPHHAAYPPYRQTGRNTPDMGFYPRYDYHGYGAHGGMYRDYRPHHYSDHREWAGEYGPHVHTGGVRDPYAGGPAPSTGNWPNPIGIRRLHSGKRAHPSSRVKENPLESAVPRSRPYRTNSHRRRVSLQSRESTSSSFNPFTHSHFGNRPISLNLDDSKFQTSQTPDYAMESQCSPNQSDSVQSNVARGVKKIKEAAGDGMRISSGNDNKPCLNPALLVDGDNGSTPDAAKSSLGLADFKADDKPLAASTDTARSVSEQDNAIATTGVSDIALDMVVDAATELQLRTEANNIILSTANAISYLAKVTEQTLNMDAKVSSISRTSTNSSTMNGFDSNLYLMSSSEGLFSGGSESMATDETDLECSQDLSLFTDLSNLPIKDMASPDVDDTAFCTWIPDKFNFDDIMGTSEYTFTTAFPDAEVSTGLKPEIEANTAIDDSRGVTAI